MNRRRFCLSTAVILTISSGCSDRQAPSATSGPESYLPDSTDEREFRDTREHGGGWTPLGAKDGIIGQYQGPDGASYEFVVMDTEETYTTGTARSLACAGWQVAIAIDGYAIAASTGTEQRTFTPEEPPQMTQTAVFGTDGRVRELLVLSPRLSETDVDENEINCEQ